MRAKPGKATNFNPLNITDMNYTAKQVQEIALNMKAYGGSFMKNIGAALLVADRENTEKILNTWPDECAQHLKYSQ